MVKDQLKFNTPKQGEHWIGERLFVTEFLNHPAIANTSLARCRVPPGITTQMHVLSVDEIYIIHKGVGRMEKNNSAPYDVGPGDCVFIPAGQAQRITNHGEQDLIFDSICTPRFTVDCYQSLEDEKPTNDAPPSTARPVQEMRPDKDAPIKETSL